MRAIISNFLLHDFETVEIACLAVEVDADGEDGSGKKLKVKS